MQIKCERCGFASYSIMPETARNGSMEHTFFPRPDYGAVYPIVVTRLLQPSAVSDSGSGSGVSGTKAGVYTVLYQLL